MDRIGRRVNARFHYSNGDLLVCGGRIKIVIKNERYFLFNDVSDYRRIWTKISFLCGTNKLTDNANCNPLYLDFKFIVSPWFCMFIPDRIGKGSFWSIQQIISTLQLMFGSPGHEGTQWDNANDGVAWKWLVEPLVNDTNSLIGNLFIFQVSTHF